MSQNSSIKIEGEGGEEREEKGKRDKFSFIDILKWIFQRVFLLLPNVLENAGYKGNLTDEKCEKNVQIP